MSISRAKQFLLLSFISTASISAAIITPSLPLIAKQFMISTSQLNILIAIFLVGYVAGQLIYGPIANRFGQLEAMQSGLMINLCGLLLSIMACYLNNFSLLLFGRLITALGAASGLCCTFSLMNSLLSEAQVKSLSAYTMLSFTLGTGLAVFIGGVLSAYFNWQVCLWFLFAYGFIQLLGSYQLPTPKFTSQAIHLGKIIADYQALLKNCSFVSFSLILGLVSVISYGYSATAPLYAAKNLHLSSSSYGTWNILNMLGMLGSSFLAAKCIKKIDSKKTLMLGLLLLCPVIIGLVLNTNSLQHSTLGFFLLSMALFLFSGLIFPTASFFAVNASSDKANASGVMSFINMGSAMIGVLIMGLLPFASIHAFLFFLGLYWLVTIMLGLISTRNLG